MTGCSCWKTKDMGYSPVCAVHGVGSDWWRENRGQIRAARERARSAERLRAVAEFDARNEYVQDASGSHYWRRKAGV